MSLLTADRFAEFYKAVHNCDPFPWQERVAARVCDPARGWPAVIALPTAAGKTACIDVAVFALACQSGSQQRTAPRRIFFVVDRRVVVDQASLHALKLARALGNPNSGVVKEVADALCALAHDSPEVPSSEVRPLDVYVLRGGMYREETWVRSPLQPTIITSTVDQVGSRLLFRGYGVSDSMRPIHAGLIGNDALILLDEAHCASPFAETVDGVAYFRNWHPSRAPFRFVRITATPASDTPSDQIERDERDDLAHEVLGKRIKASKPAKLVVAPKARSKSRWQESLVAELAKQARELMTEGYKAVGVIVNRVATARELSRVLSQTMDQKDSGLQPPEVILLTGRMRSLDRDLVLNKLTPLFSGENGPITPTFVVATQTLEVGADLDFHALVTECASLDALRQRFGRLNRVANRPTARAVIVIRDDQTDDTADDPVYGASLAKTWNWLQSRASEGVFDFGVAAFRATAADEDLAPFNAPTDSAPVLLPAHLDCWVQTAPRPAPDPEPAVFLHGPARPGIPDVQVVFRCDVGNTLDEWADIVALCPPSSSEALPVRIDLFRKWLAGESPVDDSADIEGGPPLEEETDVSSTRRTLCWAGPGNEQTRMVELPNMVCPNQTYIVSLGDEDLDRLGDFPPDAGRLDYAEAAFRRSRDRAILRLTPSVMAQWPDCFPKEEMLAFIGAEATEDDDELADRLTELLRSIGRTEVPSDLPPLWERLKHSADWLAGDGRRSVELHPAGGFVVTGKHRLRQFDPTFADDESGESPTRRSVTLEDHTRGVIAWVDRFSRGCGLDDLAADLNTAARWHDIGKADPRFQAMLQGRSPQSARPRLLAKSAMAYKNNEERDAARAIHQFPKNGRHELVSVASAANRTADNLILHLIGSHHGYARPFAPPPKGEQKDVPEPFTLAFLGESFTIVPASLDPATANRVVAERFWQMVRTHGWWGAAYLEALFRLADHAASRAEQETAPPVTKLPDVPPTSVPPPARHITVYSLPLRGLDGSNPLAYLAALGTLRLLTAGSREADGPPWLSAHPKLAWSQTGSSYVAILYLEQAIDSEALVAFLASRLVRDLKDHSAAFALELMKRAPDQRAEVLRQKVRATPPGERTTLDWISALTSECTPDAASQLQTVRRDYLEGNLQSILQRTTEDHLQRTLFLLWDYADGLNNQSLHWEPSEDRRHAYQWFVPTGDPTRTKRGGMLGANRLALEAWPLFLSWPNGEKLSTRGFSGNRVDDTSWTWPLWASPMDLDCVTSLLGAKIIQEREPDAATAAAYTVFRAFRSNRILVNKTPNLTQALAVL